MDITLLYDNAYEMLAETNVYSRPPEQLVYHDHRGEEYALLELVRSHPMIGSGRMSSDKRRGVKINNAKCYQAIAEAMVKYADSYPAPASFKKRMRANFVQWLEAIRSKYEFPEQPEIPWGLYPEDGEKDTVVGMLQSLQSRRGVTKEELQVRLGIGPRAILKDLCKLDPTLREDGAEEQETPVPFYIGGQPVRVEIRSRKYAGDRKKHYRTENSVHPLILQENLFQAATLLQALQRNYDEHESTVSSYLAVDIWSQLSDYARERIEYVFTAGDPDFAAFIEMLKDETPDGRIPAYRTEREMFIGDESISERLLYYRKADRVCPKLCLEIDGTERELTNVHITMQGRPAYGTDNRKKVGKPKGLLYIAVTEPGEELAFEEKDVIDIL